MWNCEKHRPTKYNDIAFGQEQNLSSAKQKRC